MQKAYTDVEASNDPLFTSKLDCLKRQQSITFLNIGEIRRAIKCLTGLAPWESPEVSRPTPFNDGSFLGGLDERMSESLHINDSLVELVEILQKHI